MEKLKKGSDELSNGRAFPLGDCRFGECMTTQLSGELDGTMLFSTIFSILKWHVFHKR